MATVNPFDLLGDDDNDDPSQLIASQQQKLSIKKPAAASVPQAKLPSKPLPPAQAVRESRNNNTVPVRGGAGRGGPGRGGSGRGAGFVQNRDFGSRSTNGYSGGVPAEDGVTGKTSERVQGSYGSPRESFRGGRYGGLVNGNAEGSFDPDHPQRRVYERRSGTGRGFEMKREGAGRGNWGTVTDDFLAQDTEDGVNLNEKTVASEKMEKKEGKAIDASKDKRDDAANEAEEKEPEDNEMTLEEYEKVREEKRKSLLSMKVEARKVEFDKDFEAMQQLSIKKGNDDVFIKVGSDKDSSKRRENTEKEENARKAMTINEFLKPTEGERYYSPGGRGRGRGRGSPRGGGYGGGGGGGGGAAAAPAVPLIEDPAQFPTLGGK